MKFKQLQDGSTAVRNIVDIILREKNFQDEVLTIQAGATAISSPVAGDRRIITTIASLHANYGTIDKMLTGYDEDGNPIFAAHTLADRDVVEYFADVDGVPAFAVVWASDSIAEDAITINRATHTIWRYNSDTPEWVDTTQGFEQEFTEAKEEFTNITLAANTEIPTPKTLANTPKTGFSVMVSINGEVLREVATGTPGTHGFRMDGADVYIRTFYAIASTDVVLVEYSY